MESSDLRLRILCFHGYRQNSQIFSKKLGSLRKMLKDYAEFVFIDAPHEVLSANKQNDFNSLASESKKSKLPERLESMLNEDESQPDEIVRNEEEKSGLEEDMDNVKTSGNSEPETDEASTKLVGELSWWFNKEDRTFKGTNQNGPAYGFDRSIQVVEQAWTNFGPFQGILGFSQGACLVGLLCSLARKRMTIVKPDFAVICSGFLSESLAHHGMYDGISVVPSLHIYGTNDEIITPIMSKELLGYFADPDILQHDGGHYFPATALHKNTYREFFEARLREHKIVIDLQKENDHQHR